MAKLAVKPNTNIAKAINIIAAVANEAQRLEQPREVFFTSVSDGTHIGNSRHYFGQAVDVRSKNFPNRGDKFRFIEAVLTLLGADYEGFLRDESEPNEHFHFEYDPQRNK